MMYPESIAVSQKITHMDRLEQDDLALDTASSPQPTSGGSGGTRPQHHRHFDHHNNAGVGYLPHLHQHHDIGTSGGGAGAGAGHDDVSPQWGWYVTLTPPKPEFLNNNNNKGGGNKGDQAAAAGASASAAAAAAAAASGSAAGGARSLRPGMSTSS
jgi:hypothetical protein